MFNRKSALAILAGLMIAAAPVLTAAPASAYSYTGQKSAQIRFRYNDDASTRSNYLSITRVARRSCMGVMAHSAASRDYQRTCMTDLVDQAVAKFGRQDLIAMHIEKTGRGAQMAQLIAAAE